MSTSSSRAWNKGRPSGAWCRSIPPKIRITASSHQRSRFTHYYFYIRDEVLGPIIIRVASFFPFQTTYWLNGHSFMERELQRAQVGFHKHDNAFLAVDDVAALQAAADRLSPELIRERLDYWTFILGPKFSSRTSGNVSARFYAIAQIEYCRNFIFKRHFPIHKIFERGCDLALWRLTAHKISEIFGVRLTRNSKANCHPSRNSNTAIMFSAPTARTPLSSSTKSSPFLRNEVCANNLSDFRLKKGLDHLDAVRKVPEITDRFAAFQAQWLNVHVDFPLLQRLALPVTIGTARYPGIKIHDTRIIRLLEVLLHGRTIVGGWRAKQIHQAVLITLNFRPTLRTEPAPL